MEAVAIEKVNKEITKSTNDSEARIQEIFELQKSNLQALKNSSERERRKKLKALKKKVFEYRTRIQEALYLDFKKPATESDISEIYPTISEIKHTLSHFGDWMQAEEVDTPITLLGS